MSLSLLQRVQARLNNNQGSQHKENDKAAPFDANENVDSESDIDDDISLDQCISVVEKKSQDPNSSFTRIVTLDGISTKTSSTLKEVYKYDSNYNTLSKHVLENFSLFVKFCTLNLNFNNL